MTTLLQLHARLRKGLSLTKGEKLVVLRRSVGVSQADAAKRYGVGVDKLRRWEQDLEECPRKVSNVSLKSLPLAELLRIRRQRLNLPIAYVARVMGKSVGWVHRAHTGEHVESAERLTNFILTREGRA